MVGIAQAKNRRVGRGKGVQGMGLRCSDAGVSGGAGVGAAPAFPRFGQYRVQIDQVTQALGPAVGHGGAQHAGIRMHHQNHLVHFFGVHGGHHVGDVTFKIEARVKQVGALADPGQGDGMGAVTGTYQAWQDPLPTPCAVPSAMHE
jgi:hypothetical protein